MTALELTSEGQLRVMPLSVIQELIHERNTLREERDEARAALRFIAEWGGRTLESEYGDIDCNGKWCAEQAKEALK